MRKLSTFLWMLTLAAWFAGCDSGGEEQLSAAEKMLGAWSLTGVSDGSGDQTPTFQENFDGVEVAFNGDQTYTLDVDASDDTQDVALSGPYVINEAAGTLSLTVTFAGAQLPLSLNFAFVNDDTLRLSGPSGLLNPLLGTTLEGDVSMTFARI